MTVYYVISLPKIPYIRCLCTALANVSKWVGQKRVCAPYMTVYFVISLPKVPYICCLCTALANVKHMGWPEACIYTVYDRILCDFPTKNTVCSLFMYGSGQR